MDELSKINARLQELTPVIQEIRELNHRKAIIERTNAIRRHTHRVCSSYENDPIYTYQDFGDEDTARRMMRGLADNMNQILPDSEKWCFDEGAYTAYQAKTGRTVQMWVEPNIDINEEWLEMYVRREMTG